MSDKTDETLLKAQDNFRIAYDYLPTIGRRFLLDGLIGLTRVLHDLESRIETLESTD